MSSTNRGATRQEKDCYITQPALAEAIVDWLMAQQGWIRPGEEFCVCEPSAGPGVFVRAIKETFLCHLTAVEVTKRFKRSLEAAGADDVRIGDWLDEKVGLKYDLILGNPPYLETEEHVRHAMRCLTPNGRLAYLLRLNFIGSNERWESFFPKYPPSKVVPITPRPSFLLEDYTPVRNAKGSIGSDSTEYALFVWHNPTVMTYDKKHVVSELLMHAPIRWNKPSNRQPKKRRTKKK